MRADLDLSLQSHDHPDELPQSNKSLYLDPSDYPGGIAIWGALPPVYNTSICPPDEGVHVHARMKVGGSKSIDETFSAVEVPLSGGGTFRINGIDASNYNISTVLKRRLKYLKCPDCGGVHSDGDWFAVHYHENHTCEHCGSHFLDTEPSISNPVMLLKELCGDVQQDRPIIDPVQRIISVKQERYPGGIQLWGSNPAIIWTSPKLEEGGVHFHGFYTRTEVPSVDETFGRIEIEGVQIDPETVRHLMAQQALSYLSPHITSCDCPNCGQAHFDSFEMAIDPHLCHICESCRVEFLVAERKEVVCNPLVKILSDMRSRYSEIFS